MIIYQSNVFVNFKISVNKLEAVICDLSDIQNKPLNLYSYLYYFVLNSFYINNF